MIWPSTSRTSIADTFGKLRDQVALEAPALGGIHRRLEDADPGLRRLVERARPEDEHEPAAARVLPLHLADARHARLDDPADDVEAHRVADLDLEPLVDALLDRDFPGRRILRQRRLARPERAVGHRLVRLEVIAIGDRVLPRPSEPWRRTSSNDSRFVVRPLTPVTRARMTGTSCGGPASAALRASRNARIFATCGGRISIRNMSAPLEPSSSENCCSRLACSERTPMTKKLPIPTASRMTRVWLPGRPRLRTRGGAETTARRAIGRTARTTPVLTRCSTKATPANPPQTIAPTFSDAACHAAMPHERRADQHRGHHLHPVELGQPRPDPGPGPPARVAARPPAAPRSVPPRSSSSGLTRRTSSSGTSENSSDTSMPTATPCQTADRVSPIRRRAERRADLFGNGIEREPREPHAQHAAREAEEHHLQHVRGQHLPRGRAQALQDRDAADLLPDEHARHAPDADAAEHEDHEADQTEVVLGAHQIVADLIFRVAVGIHVDEARAEVAAQLA